MQTSVYEIKKPASMKTKKRVGRGPSSGCGKTSSRGQDGQLSRSGSKKRVWFEGGQMPLQRRIPKRGFTNFTKKYFQIVKLTSLEKIGITDVTPEVLKEKRIIDSVTSPIKILGNGEITKPVNITADAFSKSAEEKIKKSGGSVTVRK